MSYLQHILVVDDNIDDARFTKLALQKVGVITPVQIVGGAAEAVEYLTGLGSYADPEKRMVPSLVLLDLNLAQGAGPELVAWLRAHPGLKRLPVIVLTSSRESGDVNRAYELGCNSYLVKPPSFNTLLVMMQGLVQYWLHLNQRPELSPS